MMIRDKNFSLRLFGIFYRNYIYFYLFFNFLKRISSNQVGEEDKIR